MNGISHKQARRYILADQDGLLSDAQRLDLQAHLAGCEACRAESESLSTLTLHLKSEFHNRWDVQDGPSQNVMVNVHSQLWRIFMSNRVNFGLRALGGIAALLVLGFGLSFVISQMRDSSVASGEVATLDNFTPASSLGAEGRLLAFTKIEDGNYDIYTIHADGSGLTNLTNNPARDANPIWSPDGKRIAFESDRTGTSQIYLMDANGSNVIQITDGDTDHNLPIDIDGRTNPWSPDGHKLLYLQTNLGKGTLTLISQNIRDESKVSITTGRILLSGISWSPDGKHIGYVQNDTPDKTPLSHPFNIYIVNADGSNQREMKKLIPQNEYFDTGFQWSAGGVSMIFTAYESYPYIETVYELDLETNSIIEKATFTTRVLDWQDDVSLIMTSETSDTIFTWQLRNGTSNTLDWGAECWEINFRRSTSGNFVIGAYCPDNKSGLYWANADGSTIKKLPALLADDMITGIGDISWSSDDQYIAFNFQTREKTNMYILNIQTALENTFIQPEEILIGEREQYVIPSWQPTVTSTPLPDSVILTGIRYEDQKNRWNYCGPANLSMALNYVGWSGNRDVIAKAIKPGIQDPKLDFIQQGRSDVNVMPYELVDFVNDETEFRALSRLGGNIDLAKKLLAADFPLIAEKGYYEKDYAGKVAWLGHYQFVTGYDDSRGELVVQDTWNDGPNFHIKYDEFMAAQAWLSFDNIFIVVYDPARESELMQVLGPYADAQWAAKHARDVAQERILATKGIDQYFAWYAKGTSHVEMFEYQDAAIAYDQAYAIYNALGAQDVQRPYRMMWYQTGPYKAYFYSGRYQDVINLADITLTETSSKPTLEESLYWRGQAYYMIGNTKAAVDDYREALRLHPNWIPAIQALQDLGIQP